MRKINDNELIQMLKEGSMTQKQMAEHFGCSEPAITKRKKRYKRLGLYNEFEVPESFSALTDKEQRYVIGRIEGKGQTEAVKEAYECTTPGSARSMGSQLMKKDEIQKAVSELMYESGLSKRNRVQILKRHVYAKDPNVSLKALDQTWKLDGAYTEKHVHVKADYGDLMARYEDIQKRKAELRRRLGLSPGEPPPPLEGEVVESVGSDPEDSAS